MYFRDPEPSTRAANRCALLGLCVLLGISACGGGGSSDTPAASPAPAPVPTGLTTRPVLASFTLPGDAGGSVQLTRRFPGLSFSAAILTKPVPATNTLLVLQQSGIGSTFVDDQGTSSSTQVLDISNRVRNQGEQGLLGGAFDPNFTVNGHLFLHYTPLDDPRRGRISRFTWSGGVVDSASELVILEVAQPFPNHNGGSIEFGPDGYLYIALGDGGAAGDPLNNAQNAENLPGAVLRIDVSAASSAQPYRIPPDNPWANAPPNRGELWAIGLRNPFRMSFDPANGELWAGDVGQSEREEVDLIEAGGNYGWRVREGFLPFDDTDNTLPLSAFTDPVIDLPRTEAQSITGGEVYRGSGFPGLNGTYIYGDFVTGNVWSLQRIAGGAPTNTLLGSVSAPAHFTADQAGEMLITSYSSGFFGFEAGSGGSDPATLLSTTGLFSSLETLTPASGLIEYAVNEPHWIDGAVARQWLGVPDGASMTFAADEPWLFPTGTLLLQHIERDTVDRGRVRLETRLLINRGTGWEAFTYVWNANQDDASLTTAGTAIGLTVAGCGRQRAQLRPCGAGSGGMRGLPQPGRWRGPRRQYPTAQPHLQLRGFHR